MIPVYTPYLTDDMLKYAHDALDSRWLTWHGKYIQMAQEKLQEILGVKHVLLTNNGTTATHLLAKAVKYRYPKANKLILPDNVYVAAWNAFLFDNDPWEIEHLDTNLDTWNADYSKVEADENTVFLIVHNVGNVINVPALKRRFPKSIFVEDNCEGFLGKYEGKYTGTESLVSSISFFSNKSITSGEGGAVITNDDELAKHLKQVICQGVSEKNYVHDVLGYNYRTTNIQAGLLYGQLLYLTDILAKKTFLFETYRQILSHMDNRVKIQCIEPDTVHSNWMMGLRLIGKSNYEVTRSHFLECGFDTRPFFYPMTVHKHLKRIAKEHVNANILASECLMLPSYPELKVRDLNLILSKIREYIKG